MKSDYGFDESEKLLNQLEKDVHKEYAQASKEMAEKVDAYFAKFKAEDEMQRAKYEQGAITKKEYTEWRQRKMLTGKRYVAMRDTLAKDLTNTDKIAMKYVNDRVIDVYALNMNYGTYSIEKDSKINTSFTLYNHDAVQRLIKDKPELLPQPSVDIPKDLRWNKQHIQSAITQGILQGKSIPDVAKNLQNVVGMDEKAAIRNARTAMTGAQNGGRLDSMKRAAARGVGLKKGWMATLDHVTRDSHVQLDGEIQELDNEFSNGCMFPGDPSGKPKEVYNCRCRLTHEYDKYKTDWSNPANRNTSKLGNMSYDEWKNKHKAKMVAKSATKAATIFNKAKNKNGEDVVFDFKISDKIQGDRRERAIQRNEATKQLITELTNEYDTYLIRVENASASKSHAAGIISMDGVMGLSSKKADTILHEFAHALATTDRVKYDLADDKEVAFIKEIKKHYKEYKNDVDKNGIGAMISSYSKTSADEFLAEGFALAKMREMGYEIPTNFNEKETKYSKEILRLVQKYFGR